MSDSDRTEMITTFSDITGESAERSEFYLSSANWTLQVALASFYEHDDNNLLDFDEETTGLPSFPSVEANPAQATIRSTGDDSKSKDKSPPPRPRIATIHNMDRSNDADEPEGQPFYAGGSERSGQQVLGPPPKKNPMTDYVSDVFSSAREHGAQVADLYTATASGSSSVFVGTGYRLGQTDNDHVALPDQIPRPHRPTNIDVVVLKLWRQGFSINDGELRNYEDPANQEFLASIKRGEIPNELRQGGALVNVDLEDHRNEEFTKIVVKPKPFSGRGHTLGSPAPTVVAPPMIPTGTESNKAEFEQTAIQQLNINADQPTTMIQVRLTDGSRLSARFNHSHTVSDIRSYIRTARPQYSATNFSLLTTFPSKELTDDDLTIEKGGLLNAAILQRLQ